MNETVLKLTNVTKSYKGTKAVNNVNMTIEKGDIYGLIGRNGAGKTTLTRLITSLAFADAGEIQLFGKSSKGDLQEARKRIGCIIENPAFYPNLTAQQNLAYYQKIKGVPNKEALHKTLEIVGLTDTGKKKVKNFSLGMKQRLGIALALLNSPDFIILDEPINGLDPVGIVEMRELIKKLNVEYRITILISSHILSELSLVATRYGIIEGGRMIKQLSHEELLEECQRSLSLKVDDTAKAVSVIETALKSENFKVTGQREVRLYDFLDNPAKVNKIMLEHGVNLMGISEEGASLEDYFTELVRGA
jgi:ABC-2 type transport system ATP-binding protein